MSPTTSSELLLLDSSEMSEEDFIKSIERPNYQRPLSVSGSKSQPTLAITIATAATMGGKPKSTKKDLIDATKDGTATKITGGKNKNASSIQLQPIALAPTALVASPEPFGNLRRQDSTSSLGSTDDKPLISNHSTGSINSGSQQKKDRDRDSQPEELALLPYLVCKGNFLEAERMLRMAVGKQTVDEGAGLKRLLLLMEFQAEMYKLMGLWPLSIGIYLDCAGK